MIKPQPNRRSWLGAFSIGIAVSLLTAIVMIVATRAGLSPFPKPPSLAFAETILGHTLPLPVGLLFHTAYVTFWSVIFVQYFPKRSFWLAMTLAGGLWFVILAVFFPVIGWGFAGIQVSPKLIPASFVPHLLFGLSLWALETFIPHKQVSSIESNQT